MIMHETYHSQQPIVPLWSHFVPVSTSHTTDYENNQRRRKNEAHWESLEDEIVVSTLL